MREPKIGDLIEYGANVQKIEHFGDGDGGTYIGNGTWVCMSDYDWTGSLWQERPDSHANVGCTGSWEANGRYRRCADCKRALRPLPETKEKIMDHVIDPTSDTPKCVGNCPACEDLIQRLAAKLDPMHHFKAEDGHMSMAVRTSRDLAEGVLPVIQEEVASFLAKQ